MRKLSWFAFPFGGAVLLTIVLGSVWGFCLGAACCASFGVLLLRRRGWSRLAVAAIGLAAGFVWTAAYESWISAPVRALENQTVPISALLRDDPEPLEHGACVSADAEIGGHTRRLLLYLDDLPDARMGDTMHLTVQLQAEALELYYRTIGVELVAYARTPAQVVPAAGLTLKIAPLLLRRVLTDQIRRLFPADCAPFVIALLTGDRSDLSYAQKNELSISGIYHIVAISGLHISVLLGLVLLLCGKRRYLAAGIGIPVVLFYTLMVGAVPSVVRAAVMQTLVLLALLLRRESDALSGMAAALLVLLIPNPYCAANLGLQLSFGAMAGILLLSGPISRRLSWMEPKKGKLAQLPARYARSVIASSCSAMVFTVPLIAAEFGIVSLVSLLTNLLTLWAVTLIFEAGLLLLALSFLWLWPAVPLAWVLAWPARYVLAVSKLCAGLPMSAVYTDNVYILPWLVFVYGACLVCFWKGRRGMGLLFVCATAVTLCLCLFLGYFDSSVGAFRMTMLDVGQGQCLVFQGDDFTVLYDCGGKGRERAGETAAHFLLSQGCTRIDALILSHYDQDHAGGVCSLMDEMEVALLYLPDTEAPLRQSIEQSAARYHTEVRYVTEDERLSGSGAEVRVFAPVTTASENDASLALLYSRGSFDILATGDLSATAERLLLREVLPDIEVLVAGHHGAATSTCQTLLEQTKPETVLISVGEDNGYGHPSAQTLSRIVQSGAAVYRTDLNGTITVRD